jgi:hypothetical protein
MNGATTPINATAAARLALRASVATVPAADMRTLITHATTTMYADGIAAEIVTRIPPLPRIDEGDTDRAISIAVRELQRYGLDVDANTLSYAIGVQVGLRMAHLMKGGQR